MSPANLSSSSNATSIASNGGRRKRTSSSASRSGVHELTETHRGTDSSRERSRSGATSGLSETQGFAQPLRPIPGSPNSEGMSLNRTPSPNERGGWHSPGLAAPRRSPRRHSPSPRRAQFDTMANGVTWEAAQVRAAQVNGFKPQPRSERGFFRRNLRSLSSSLPRFYSPQEKDFAQKEKLGRGRILSSRLGRAKNFINVLSRQILHSKKRLILLLCLVLICLMFYATPLHRVYQRTTWLGGGKKFVIILASNQGGGVMEWKGPREWAIERDSIKNKKDYANRHGYDLDIVDMTLRKRYAHEWRESWEKVDAIRRCLREYPSAEWFWWLDINTFIMEPSYSLQRHIFNDLGRNSYRDINVYNPLNITHPLDLPYLDPVTASAVGDNRPSSINMLVPQDCSGFNLGSFFMRRSKWTDYLLDIWWDPVLYEQKHMQWEHKEQDAFEHLYTSQPWVRPHTAFVPQRKICSFPEGACGDHNDRWHYNEKDRDFLVNMAGCEWGRDCWGEMYNFRELSNRLNRGRWEKFKDKLNGFIGKLKEKLVPKSTKKTS